MSTYTTYDFTESLVDVLIALDPNDPCREYQRTGKHCEGMKCPYNPVCNE